MGKTTPETEKGRKMKVKFVEVTPDTRLAYLKSMGCNHQDAIALIELDRLICVHFLDLPEKRKLNLQRMAIWRGRTK